MKTIITTLFLFFSLASHTQNLPFQVGEQTKFVLKYGPVKVGTAELLVSEVTPEKNKPSYRVLGTARSAPFFDWFFKVRDLYETYIDTATLLPIFFNRDVYEGGHIIKQQYFFDHKLKIATNKYKKRYEIFENTQDMLSALFYARTLKKEEVFAKKSFFVPIFMDEENFLLEVKYIKNDTINTKWGDISCMVFMPNMQEGRVFEDEEVLKIWISDDKNKLLLKVEAEIWAGSVKAEISDYKNLKHPISFFQTKK